MQQTKIINNFLLLLCLAPFITLSITENAHCAQLTVNQVEKTADLSTLINETLAINNKTLAGSSQPNSGFKDDWTFDMVEYDLIEFLQDLSARYQSANKSDDSDARDKSPSLQSDLSEESKLQAKNEKVTEAVDSNSAESPTYSTATTVFSSSNSLSVVTTTRPAAFNAEVNQSADRRSDSAGGDNLSSSSSLPETSSGSKAQQSNEPNESKSKSKISSDTTKPPLMSTSLASVVGDHEISESKWQYGIFDRFTRPKSTSTTTVAPDIVAPLVLDENGQIDMRNFNTEECGLRTYDDQSRYYPDSSSYLDDQVDAVKDLSQRRQKLPVNSPLGQSKKTHPFGGSSSLDDELDRNNEKLAYDSYKDSNSGGGGGSSSGGNSNSNSNNKPLPSSSSSNNEQSSASYQSPDSGESPTITSGGGSESFSGADSEFNLANRRQWLQQQLGNTLQLLGFNATSSQSISDYFNETSNNGIGALGFSGRRENMMKKSSKVAKSAAMGLADEESDQLLPGNGAHMPGSIKNNHYHQQQQQQQQDSFHSTSSSSSFSPSFQENLASIKTAVRRDDQELPVASLSSLAARQDELKLEARVIGGSDARLGDSPWSVSLQALVSRPGTGGIEYRHYCGGTIISEYYVLTAAHCLDFMVGRESRLFVVIGDLNWRMSAASLYGRRFGIEKLIIHSGYKSTAFGHDIGLIKVKESMRPVKVNGRYIINSVCLPEKGVEHSGEAELVGWGLFSNRNEMADSLQIADVPILPRPLCVDLYRRRTGLIQWLIGIELITEKQVCAGTFGRGICQGDSGSALVFNEKVSSLRRNHNNGLAGAANAAASVALGAVRQAKQRKRVSGRTDETKATIIGIVAFGGIRRCSYQSLPGVYMQTSKYMDWILPRIQNLNL